MYRRNISNHCFFIELRLYDNQMYSADATCGFRHLPSTNKEPNTKSLGNRTVCIENACEYKNAVILN